MEVSEYIPQAVRNPYANGAAHEIVCTKQPRALNLKEHLVGFDAKWLDFLKSWLEQDNVH